MDTCVQYRTPGASMLLPEQTIPLNEVLASRAVLNAILPGATGLTELLARLTACAERLDEACVHAERASSARNILLGSLLHGKLELRQPLPVHVEGDGQSYVASTADLDLYGSGRTAEDALDDLRVAIVEYYTDLAHEKLGPQLARRFAYLASIIIERA